VLSRGSFKPSGEHLSQDPAEMVDQGSELTSSLDPVPYLGWRLPPRITEMVQPGKRGIGITGSLFSLMRADGDCEQPSGRHGCRDRQPEIGSQRSGTSSRQGVRLLRSPREQRMFVLWSATGPPRTGSDPQERLCKAFSSKPETGLEPVTPCLQDRRSTN
jgi:hypothetical protein